MKIPAELKYTKEHEWVGLTGKVATVGITDHAQAQLGDVVMVELPALGSVLAKDDTFGVVESVKAVSDIFAPVSGKVIDVNQVVTETTGLINEDCYGTGWLIKIELSELDELNGLMSAESYQAYLEEEV